MGKAGSATLNPPSGLQFISAGPGGSLQMAAAQPQTVQPQFVVAGAGSRKTGTIIETFKCEVCNQVFQSMGALQNHVSSPLLHSVHSMLYCLYPPFKIVCSETIPSSAVAFLVKGSNNVPQKPTTNSFLPGKNFYYSFKTKNAAARAAQKSFLRRMKS